MKFLSEKANEFTGEAFYEVNMAYVNTSPVGFLKWLANKEKKLTKKYKIDEWEKEVRNLFLLIEIFDILGNSQKKLEICSIVEKKLLEVKHTYLRL